MVERYEGGRQRSTTPAGGELAICSQVATVLHESDGHSASQWDMRDRQASVTCLQQSALIETAAMVIRSRAAWLGQEGPAKSPCQGVLSWNCIH